MTLPTRQLAAMTERAFWISLAPMPHADQLRALTLFREWRFAAACANDGRPLPCAAPWKRAATAKAAELQGFLARHAQPIASPPYAAQVNALRALAISAFHRGAIQ
ncbi:hypothetical protein C0V97_09125 [Asaia sp. W19]|uniref:hypothetical protein n=1 Tax=unclassified Asaia TaxID=2685023 RepID=UPI000F8CBE4A|nr:hypothetical protein [Asaia sp. W19]RUT25985.1 hypothetical protein C0V97_09125 [Asaia sp. W19]